jgi:hypothetical protein
MVQQSDERKPIMKDATKRSVLRWAHLVCAIPIIGYIYSPFAVLPDYAPATRFVFVPVMLASGLWMWKGHVLRRLIFKRPAPGRTRETPTAQRKHRELSFESRESGS